MINVLIADDHAFFADGVMLSLRDTEIKVVEYISKSDEIVDAFLRLDPDILLCDIRFGDELNGFDALQRLIEIKPTAKVILLSQFDQDKMIKESYKRGAKAFLSKSTSSEELIEAIKQVAKGELYFTPGNAIKLAKMTYDKDRDDLNIKEILNTKETEVFLLLADGKTEKEVANLLSVSLKTITNYKATIKDKLKVESVTEMTKIAVKNNLIK